MKLKKSITFTVILLCTCLFSHNAAVKASAEKSFKKLVILPLENLGKKSKDTDSIGREISLSLTQSLSQIRELSVIDPHTVRIYFIQKLAFVQTTGSGDEEAIKKELGKFEKLDIDLVLSGTYRIIGKEIKVIIQLIDVTSGEVKITPVTMKEKYPDNLFYLEEIIAEKTAYSISTMFESYYRNFASFYKFTTNREAYRLYLAGIDAKSDQTIQGYARAIKCFYESYRMDNSFMLPFEEILTLKKILFENIDRAAMVFVAGFGDDKNIVEALFYFIGEKGLLSRVILSANESKNKYINTNPEEFKKIYENYSASPFKDRGRDVKTDIENFPNDIETLFYAWEKIDSFNPESKYRKKIIAINPGFIPLLVADFFEEIKRQQAAYKKQADEVSQQNPDEGQSTSKYNEKALKKYNESLVSLKNKIDAFNKKNPGAKYSTIYLKLFSGIYFNYYITILANKLESGIDVDFKNEKILQYCLSYYDDYVAVMNKEFNKITIK